jgi:hydroxyacylglutathione hydrolase
MPAWQAVGLPSGQVHLVPAADITGPVLDVRQDSEFEAGHIPGARHSELGALADAAGRPGGGPLTVMCGHGERAMTGASLLRAGGHSGVAVAVGGPDDWATARNLPLEAGR